jgi:hypothetical protein
MSTGTSAATALTTAATSPHAAHRKLAAPSPTRRPNLAASVTWKNLSPWAFSGPTVAATTPISVGNTR